MTDLPLLISTLEEGGEGSREVDARIAAALRIGPTSNPPGWVTHWAGPFIPHPKFPGKVALAHTDGSLGMHWNAPALTTSVDAALALIGERLPGAYGRVEPRFYEPEDVRWIGFTIRPHWDRWSPVSDEWFDVSEARAATPALALCLALLKAVNQGETHDA